MSKSKSDIEQSRSQRRMFFLRSGCDFYQPQTGQGFVDQKEKLKAAAENLFKKKGDL